MKTWGYLFTQPLPQSAPHLGSKHIYVNLGSTIINQTFIATHIDEVKYVYGQPVDTSPSALKVSTIMMDYWISFATSLDPNDGKGIERNYLFFFFPL
jgi:carboxylesterase type B